jgi:hypothetical protein
MLSETPSFLLPLLTSGERRFVLFIQSIEHKNESVFSQVYEKTPDDAGVYV